MVIIILIADVKLSYYFWQLSSIQWFSKPQMIKITNLGYVCT
jgi:hypothetical protein